jgi:hypothetical protein
MCLSTKLRNGADFHGMTKALEAAAADKIRTTPGSGSAARFCEQGEIPNGICTATALRIM